MAGESGEAMRSGSTHLANSIVLVEDWRPPPVVRIADKYGFITSMLTPSNKNDQRRELAGERTDPVSSHRCYWRTDSPKKIIGSSPIFWRLATCRLSPVASISLFFEVTPLKIPCSVA
jgi:hypothetical protein